ncbi:MAG: hypothetical protein MUF42_17695 [Cytophagaceae bacterium]|nr:hypothetical protein [Cytophagaceae bacterium]
MDALKFRLKAASLLETIIALLITLTVFGISAMVYVQLLRSGLRVQTLKASQRMSELADEMRSSQHWGTETFKEEGFIIEKTTAHYAQQPSLMQLELIAADEEGRVLASHRALILPRDP